MLFRVTKQFPRGPELDVQKFMTREAAERFIQDKLAEDLRFKLLTIYRLYDDLDMLLKEYTANDVTPSSSDDNSASSGKESGKRFSPSPFNIAPRPGGLPHSSFRDDPKEDKKK